MTTTPILKRKKFTTEEYHQLADVGILKPTDRVELINGEIVHMSPIKSTHASINDDLVESLILALNGQAIIKAQNPIKLGKYSEPEPDIVIAKYQSHKYRHKHPKPKDIHWIIEVSDTTLKKDRTVKKKMYLDAGISEYWIINIPDECIEVYRDLKDGDYQTVEIAENNDIVEFKSLGFKLAVNSLF